ncbi:MAG: hypothetical protein FRX49_13175 [Trebouxia sp. A1-2]|nr:MAG: hypothetical protein FRX49_13175 [Trebouxia sp. A1-2]
MDPRQAFAQIDCCGLKADTCSDRLLPFSIQKVARRYKSVDRVDKEEDAWHKLGEEEHGMKAEPAGEECGMLLKLDTKAVLWCQGTETKQNFVDGRLIASSAATTDSVLWQADLGS